MTKTTESGVLYVVATPLGNLEDLSPRALRTLGAVRWIACEDTRRTGQLLQACGVRTPMISYHQHNEAARVRELIAKLKDGNDIALVSDAGTPAISDPGERLVAAAHEAAVPVIPLPGPSAAIAALSVSGLDTSRFLFVGFLPSRPAARRKAIAELAQRSETLVLYESPLRATAALHDLAQGLGDRDAFLCREATKLHEEYLRGTLASLRDALGARAAVKGEIVLVVAGASAGTAPKPDAGDPLPLLRELRAAGMTPRAAAREASRRTGVPTRDLYRALVQDGGAEGSAD
jgi:16S rRNA (cytidine1402-2'-O)-methyltransferase